MRSKPTKPVDPLAMRESMPPMSARMLRTRPPKKRTIFTWYFFTTAQPETMRTRTPNQGNIDCMVNLQAGSVE